MISALRILSCSRHPALCQEALRCAQTHNNIVKPVTLSLIPSLFTCHIWASMHMWLVAAQPLDPRSVSQILTMHVSTHLPTGGTPPPLTVAFLLVKPIYNQKHFSI